MSDIAFSAKSIITELRALRQDECPGLSTCQKMVALIDDALAGGNVKLAEQLLALNKDKKRTTTVDDWKNARARGGGWPCYHLVPIADDPTDRGFCTRIIPKVIAVLDNVGRPDSTVPQAPIWDRLEVLREPPKSEKAKAGAGGLAELDGKSYPLKSVRVTRFLEALKNAQGAPVTSVDLAAQHVRAAEAYRACPPAIRKHIHKPSGRGKRDGYALVE